MKPEGHMPDDPLIEKLRNERSIEELRNSRFQYDWNKWIIGLVLLVISFLWMFFHANLTREPNLPNRPFARADLPLLKKKVRFLKADANTAAVVFPHLKNKAEIQAAQKALEELCYTPDLFPAIAQMHRVQNARVIELQPDLAEYARVRQEFEDGRYEIANNPAITDKAAAIADLKKKFGAAMKDPEYSKNGKQYNALLPDLIGDPEFDRAKLEYQNAFKQAALKHHPELAGFFHELESRDAAYHDFMAQANALSRQIKALETGTEPPRPAAAKPEATATGTVSRAGNAGKVNVQTNRPDTAAAPPAAAAPAPPALPEQAARRGVNVGDVVEISALKPMIALRRATITAMDNEQLTVRAGSDSYTVRWNDLTKLRASGNK